MGIRINALDFSYAEQPLYKDLSLTLPDRGIFALTGPSGCGKTTLLRLIAGLESPQSGSVEVDGRVSAVFQEDRLFPWMTALENVAVVSGPETAGYWLDAVGLGGEQHRFPRELSGGMCRRVAIARALLSDAPLLLLDEPLKGLDEETKASVAAVIRRHAEGKTLLAVTHDEEDAALLGASVIVL
jgi:NitT/TauT family transport system ATP-binding protein